MIRSNLENMLIVDVSLAEDGYNYYGYVSSGEDARYIIMRENVAETEYRYKFGAGTGYATDWAGRTGLTYIRPNQLQGKDK